MSTHHSAYAASLLAALLLLGGCAPKSPDTSKVLATVNGESITEKDFEDYLRARHMQQPAIPDKDREKKQVLEEMVKLVLLTQSAADQKVDQDLDVYFQVKRHRQNILARAVLHKYLKDNPISDEEVEKRYKDLTEKADRNEYRARHVLVRSEEEAREVLAALAKGTPFATLAKQKSADIGSGKKGGEIPNWFSQEQVVAPFFDAVKSLKKGETTKEPVKTEYGWHIIQKIDSRPRKIPTFEQSKGNVRVMVQQERVEAFINSSKEKAKIKIND